MTQCFSRSSFSCREGLQGSGWGSRMPRALKKVAGKSVCRPVIIYITDLKMDGPSRGLRAEE